MRESNGIREKEAGTGQGQEAKRPDLVKDPKFAGAKPRGGTGTGAQSEISNLKGNARLGEQGRSPPTSCSPTFFTHPFVGVRTSKPAKKFDEILSEANGKQDLKHSRQRRSAVSFLPLESGGKRRRVSRRQGVLAGARQGWDRRVANEACAPHGTLRFGEVWKRGISKAC